MKQSVKEFLGQDLAGHVEESARLTRSVPRQPRPQSRRKPIPRKKRGKNGRKPISARRKQETSAEKDPAAVAAELLIADGGTEHGHEQEHRSIVLEPMEPMAAADAVDAVDAAQPMEADAGAVRREEASEAPEPPSIGQCSHTAIELEGDGGSARRSAMGGGVSSDVERRIGGIIEYARRCDLPRWYRKRAGLTAMPTSSQYPVGSYQEIAGRAADMLKDPSVLEHWVPFCLTFGRVWSADSMGRFIYDKLFALALSEYAAEQGD